MPLAWTTKSAVFVLLLVLNPYHYEADRSSRRLLSSNEQIKVPNRKSVWSDTGNPDNICIICADAIVSTKYNIFSANSHNSSQPTFPHCHGYLFCDKCIGIIESSPDHESRRCPLCRRTKNPISILRRNSLLLRFRQYRASRHWTVNRDHIQQGFSDSITSASTRDVNDSTNPSNTIRRNACPRNIRWIQYTEYIEQLQERDNDTSSCNLWKIHHPLRHRLRNAYYKFVHRQFQKPAYYGIRYRSGCVVDFATFTVSSPWCFYPIGCVGCSVGYTFSLCCCFYNGFCGRYCRDFCLCEPPMPPSRRIPLNVHVLMDNVE